MFAHAQTDKPSGWRTWLQIYIFGVKIDTDLHILSKTPYMKFYVSS